MTIATGLSRSLLALKIPNYRLWFLSLGVSVSGNWMQTTALGWLVVQVTGDGLALGTVLALQYMPLLIFGPYGGSLVDRFDVRRWILITQFGLGILAFVLWSVTAAGLVTMPIVYGIALLVGILGVVDNPARRAFLSEIVPFDRMASAVGLQSVLVNSGRVVGPAIAAIVIAVAGVAPTFLLNALSFIVVIGAVMAMRRSQLIPRDARPDGSVHFIDTLRYVAHIPELRAPLLSMAIVGTFAFEFAVALPLLSTFTFGGDGSTYGYFLTVLSLGAILGSIAVGAFADLAGRWLEGTCFLFGATMLLAAAAPTITLEFVCLFVMGMAAFAYATVASTSIQMFTRQDHRGRVLALWSMAFLGSTVIGAPIVGWVGTVVGPRAAIVMGAISAFVGAGVIVADRALSRRRPLLDSAAAAPQTGGDVAVGMVPIAPTDEEVL